MTSKEEALALKIQLEDQKEKAQKEMLEMQRHGNDAQSEAERGRSSLRRLEEEVGVTSVCVHACVLLVWSVCCLYYEVLVCFQ